MEFATKEEATNYVLAMSERVEKEVNEIDKAYGMEGLDAQVKYQYKVGIQKSVTAIKFLGRNYCGFGTPFRFT